MFSVYIQSEIKYFRFYLHVWNFLPKVGQRLGEFYVSLYTIYVNSQDPAIGVTLTFIHNSVSVHCLLVFNTNFFEMCHYVNIEWEWSFYGICCAGFLFFWVIFLTFVLSVVLCSAAALLWNDWSQSDWASEADLPQTRRFYGAHRHVCKWSYFLKS